MFNWKKFDNNINQYACQELIMNMELFDELFFKKYDKSKYTLLERRKRKQLTKYGKIEIKRRKYRDKVSGNIIVPVDDFFGIIKNSNINADLWNTIFDEVDSGSTIPQIKKIIPDAKISHSSISGILSSKKPIITSNEVIKKK